MLNTDSDDSTKTSHWYSGITWYQWLVLIVASLGWIFDVFEGQVLLSSEKQMLTDLLPSNTSEGARDYYKYLALASFLLGGAVGGVVFGALADRIGRVRTMIFTILMYSLFTCLTAFSQNWWHVVVLRFLVALGTGGEWAVASALVAEVFPPKARAWSGAIFHGSSTFGTYLAIAAGMFIVPIFGWQRAFIIGALPALLTLWVRWQIKEPEQWTRDRAVRIVPQTAGGQLAGLFAPGIVAHTLLGFSLAVIGLATFWGVHIHGKEMAFRRAKVDIQRQAEVAGLAPAIADDNSEAAVAVRRRQETELKRFEMLGMLLGATGGGLGLFAFGPICERMGRKKAFILFHCGGFIMGLLMFQTYLYWPTPIVWLLLVLFGFWTLGMHAGYAIYFPELFPTRMRSLGAGFCFNCGRIAAAAVLILNAFARHYEIPLETVGTGLSFLFLVGAVIAAFGPETKGTTLAS